MGANLLARDLAQLSSRIYNGYGPAPAGYVQVVPTVEQAFGMYAEVCNRRHATDMVCRIVFDVRGSFLRRTCFLQHGWSVPDWAFAQGVHGRTRRPSVHNPQIASGAFAAFLLRASP
jgi:hypothetical protein